MAYNRAGYYKRAEQIQAIVREHYEPGRQDRCLKWVWRKYVEPVYGMCYVTFLKYANAELKKEPEPEDRRQMKLF